jgi:signal transduction histidine kinase
MHRMRHALRLALAAAPALLAAACAGAPATPGPAPGAFDPARAPPALAPLVARASEAVDQVQRALSRRLVEELADAPNAVRVCRDEAPAITAEVAQALGVELGRTSHRLRNPGNAPRAWVRPALAQAAGRPAAEVRPVAFDLGDRIGYLRPIGVGAPCLKCHGPAAELSPGVRAALQGAYPADQATGFEDGAFRGFFWAEARK